MMLVYLYEWVIIIEIFERLQLLPDMIAYMINILFDFLKLIAKREVYN